jgi:inner membrane protein
LQNKVLYKKNNAMQPASPTFYDRLNSWLRGSVTLKLFSIGVLLLLLLIPSNIVEGLITERAGNRDTATSEISAQWGGPQLLMGPVLVLPYTVRETDAKGRVSESTRYLSFLPDTLATTGTLAPERRHRGIYEAVVYRAQLQVRGSFESILLAEAGIPAAAVRWREAFVAVGISDMKGIRTGLALRWDGQPQRFEPGLPSGAVLPLGTAPGISTQVMAVASGIRIPATPMTMRAPATAPAARRPTASAPWYHWAQPASASATPLRSTST